MKVNKDYRHSKPTFLKSDFQTCQKVIESHYLAKGPQNKDLEEYLCQRYQRKYCHLVSSGANALFLALHVLKKDFKKVTLPSYVCAALLNSANMANYQTDIIDTSKDSLFMDPNKSLKSDKELIIYPQMFGCVQKLNFKKNKTIIEDCAMTLGKTALKQGLISITSFYATKMITSGQGGALLTDDKYIHEELKDITTYDNQEHYRQRFNFDLSDLNAALLKNQFKHLDSFIDKRRRLTSYYDSYIKKYNANLLAYPEGISSQFEDAAPFRYWILCKNIDESIDKLSKTGIECKRPVFKPLHRYMNKPDKNYPNTVFSQKYILSLPLYPGLNKSDINFITKQVTNISKPID